VFIERPDLDRNRRFGALEFADAGLELFLNRTCSYRLALGLAGRGTWRVRSRRRRYSTPRWGDTVRPIAQLLQLDPVKQRGGAGIVQPAIAQPSEAVIVVAPQDLADPGRRIARDLRHELRRTPLAEKPDDVKVTAFNAVGRGLVAALQVLGRVMRSEKDFA
jgi:hypothetical protein